VYDSKVKIGTMEKSKLYLITRVITIKGTHKRFQDFAVRSSMLISKLKNLNPKTNTVSDLCNNKKKAIFYFFSS